MKTNIDKKIRLVATDGVSAVIDRISGKIPKLSNRLSRAQKKFERMEQATRKFNATLKKVGAGTRGVGTAMTVGLTLPVVAFGKKMTDTALKFQTSMNMVQSKSGATASEMKKLEKQALKLGASTQFSASQAADAQAFFAQAGFDSLQILKATPGAMNLASATTTSLSDSANILAGTLGGFGAKADQAARFVDVLALASSRGKVTLASIGETMVDAGPVAKGFGASLEETTSFITKLGDASILGSKAGTTLKSMFLNLASPTATAKKLLKDLGVQVVDGSTGKFRKMTDVLLDMNKAFKLKNIGKAKKLAILDKVFGRRAIAGATVLVDQVAFLDKKTGKTVNTVSKLTKELENASGAAKKMTEINQQGIKGVIDNLVSAWEAVQLAFFKSGLGDTLEGLLEHITDFFRWIADLNPQLLQFIGIVAGMTAVIGPLLIIVGSIIGALPFLLTGVNLLIVAFGGAQIALLPLLIVMGKFLLVAGLVAGAAFLVMKNWKPIKEFFADMFTSPLEQAKELAGWAAKAIGFKGGTADNVDQNLISQGFTIVGADGKQVEATGSKALQKKSRDFHSSESRARLDVKFANMPEGAKAKLEQDNNSFNVMNLGMMGKF